MPGDVPLLLRAARRRLEEVPGFEMTGDWSWNENEGVWVLRCTLTLAGGKGELSRATSWYILAASEYPFGRIQFHPAKDGGIAETYPHQNFNGDRSGDLPWRPGDLCLVPRERALGRFSGFPEPLDSEGRLKWHVERALQWLQDAQSNRLAVAGDPFEVPHFPFGTERSLLMAFDEDQESFAQWSARTDSVGLVHFVELRRNAGTLVVTEFLGGDGSPICRPSWGFGVDGEEKLGIWVRLPKVPVLGVWQAPSTWSELGLAFEAQDLDFEHSCREQWQSLRDGRAHLLLVGFPIPQRIGEPECQMRWQAASLPILSHGKQVLDGFRANEVGYVARDRLRLRKGSARVGWIPSQNWSVAEATSRGQFGREFCDMNVFVIGAGAIGSMIGELLIRGGLRALGVSDGDLMERGNLVRHTLTLNELRRSKAVQLAQRLNALNPFARAVANQDIISSEGDETKAAWMSADAILDCTGDNRALHYLARETMAHLATFISVSVGYGGKRLFLFAARSAAFPESAFHEEIRPWLDQELAERDGLEPNWEGTGCWHPVFPARADDCWLWASIAIKFITAVAHKEFAGSRFAVYEQRTEDGAIVSIDRRQDSVHA